jgi:DNA-binding IclR family transcriptional regulator
VRTLRRHPVEVLVLGCGDTVLLQHLEPAVGQQVHSVPISPALRVILRVGKEAPLVVNAARAAWASHSGSDLSPDPQPSPPLPPPPGGTSAPPLSACVYTDFSST